MKEAPSGVDALATHNKDGIAPSDRKYVKRRGCLGDA